MKQPAKQSSEAPTLKKRRWTIDLSPGQSKLWDADTTKKKLLLACAGEQGGKTILGCLWLRREFDKYRGREVAAVVGAPTYKILKQSTIATYRKFLTPALGSWGEVDGVFKFKDGRRIWFRSGTDPDSVIGIPNVVAAHLDEAGKCSRMFFFNIQGRCARMSGPMILTTTPYAMNYVPKEIIAPHEDGRRTDIEYARWPSWENPTYPREEAERLKQILPMAIYKRRVEGLHTKMEGLVFEDFADDNWINDFDFRGSDVYAGVDWGFEHPFAVEVRAIPGDGTATTISLFKGSGLSVSQQMDVLKSKKEAFGIKLFLCGHDRPDMIAEMNKIGLPALTYFEGRPDYREINAGNQKHAELIRSKRYFVLKHIDYSKELQDEYDTYHWDMREGEEISKNETPVQLNEDLLSASRFCTVGTMHLMDRPVKPVKTVLDYELRVDRFDPSDSVRKIDDWTNA